MGDLGEHDDVPHCLIPLELAVSLIRSKVYAGRTMTDQGRDGDSNMLANFIAGTVPVYEYSEDPSEAPRALRKVELEGGLFRDAARELRFIDGRATKRYLALNAVDVECVTLLLQEPERATLIHSRFVRLRAQKLRRRAAVLSDRAAVLRRQAALLRSPSQGASFPFERGGNRV